MNILIIGHSHINCMKKAFQSLSVDHEIRQKGHHFSFYGIPTRHKDLGPKADFNKLFLETSYDHILLLLNSNEYMGLCSTMPRKPYDFYGSAEDSQTLLNTAYPAKPQITSVADWLRRLWIRMLRFTFRLTLQHKPKPIPYHMVKNWLTARMRTLIPRHKHIISLIKDHKSQASIHLLLPPPTAEDSDFKFPRSDHRVLAKIRGFYPPHFRLKIYQMGMMIFQDIADELGLPIISNNSFAMDEKGMLNPAFYGRDIAHANTKYGELYLEKIIKTVEKTDAPL